MDLERRADAVEQILPTLLTRTEFKTAMEDLRVGMLGVFAERTAEIRTHFDVVAESLRAEIRLIAEGHGYLVTRLDGVDRRLDGIDQRLDGVDRRLDGIDQRLDGVDRRLDGIDHRLDGIDGRLDRLERRP